MVELSAWLRAVLSTVDNVPAIVAHESCHYNQRYNSAPDSGICSVRRCKRAPAT
jgi:uncharacterized protein YjaZ